MWGRIVMLFCHHTSKRRHMMPSTTANHHLLLTQAEKTRPQDRMGQFSPFLQPSTWKSTHLQLNHQQNKTFGKQVASKMTLVDPASLCASVPAFYTTIKKEKRANMLILLSCDHIDIFSPPIQQHGSMMSLHTPTWTVLLALICSWWRRSHCWLCLNCKHKGPVNGHPCSRAGGQHAGRLLTFRMLLRCFCSLSRSVGRATLMNLWMGASRRLSVSLLPSSAMCPPAHSQRLWGGQTLHLLISISLSRTNTSVNQMNINCAANLHLVHQWNVANI